jgi:hypothetical protein
MQALKATIFRFLPEEKKFLHKIYSKFIDDHSYLWSEAENLDLAKLRHILLVIIKLFYEEHKSLNDISQIDQQEFNRVVRELINDPDALLQRARAAQIMEIEHTGLEAWFNAFKRDIEKINQIIQKYANKRNKPRVYIHHMIVYPDQIAHVKGMKQFLVEKVKPRRVGDKILDYSVINGEKIRYNLPDFWEFALKFQQLAEALWGGPLVLLPDLSAININFVGPGEQQGFHTDRNEVTILLYLTTPRGGALEYIDSGGNIQQIPAETGKIVGLVGANQIKHRVTSVEEGEERITLVASFGLPGREYADPRKDKFLYTNEPVKNQKVFE